MIALPNDNPRISRKLVVALLILVPIIIVSVIWIIVRVNTPAPAQTESPQEKSRFAFTGLAGWRQGPSNETSMVLFSPASANGTSVCFTSAEFIIGMVDIPTDVQKNKDLMASSGLGVAAIGAPTLTLSTNEGSKQYQLHQFHITSPTPGQVMGGNAIGYVQLSDGFIKIVANCNTAEQLPMTIPALEAYRVLGSS